MVIPGTIQIQCKHCNEQMVISLNEFLCTTTHIPCSCGIGLIPYGAYSIVSIHTRYEHIIRQGETVEGIYKSLGIENFIKHNYSHVQMRKVHGYLYSYKHKLEIDTQLKQIFQEVEQW